MRERHVCKTIHPSCCRRPFLCASAVGALPCVAFLPLYVFASYAGFLGVWVADGAVTRCVPDT